jgi:TonB family protein
MKLLTMWAALMLAAAVQAAAPSSEPPTELLPSGKWQVEYAKSSCIISRAFGEGAQKMLFGLKPAPYSDVVSIFVIQPSQKGRGVRGTADVKLSSGFVPQTADFTSVTASGMRVTTISLSRATLDALAKGDSIAIKAGNLVKVSLKPSAFDKALKSFDECEADLLESWGFSRAAQAAIAERPKGTLIGLFSPDDYPSSAIESGISGTVGFRLRIEAQGDISECAVIESSGSSILDRATCAIAKKRAHFLPAIGKDGKPTWSFTFSRVTWMLG